MPPAEPDLRRQILEATRRLLVTEGYARLSMRKIAGSIGFSATSLYLYFESKDALFHTLIDEGMAQLFSTMQAAAAAHEPGSVERVEALCRAYLAFGLSQPEYYEIMFVLHPAQARRYPAERYRRARRSLDLIADALQAAVTSGMIVADDPRGMANVLWASLHGAISLWLSRRLDAGIEPATFTGMVLRHAVRSLLPMEVERTIPA